MSTDWGIPVAASTLLVVVFACGALYSRAVSSLHIANCWVSAWFLLFLPYFLSLPIAGLVVLFSRRWRKITAIRWACFGAALALSSVAFHTFAYPRQSAMEALIETFEPIVGAVERFEREQSRLPQTLDELVPRYLDQIPTGQLVGEPIRPSYRVEFPDGNDRSWLIEAGGYVFMIFDGPIGEIEYRSDQHYEKEKDPKEDVRDYYHGWQWVIWS